MKKIIICAICAICGFTTANAQAKFGHVNTQEIMQAMPEYAQAETEIKALQSQYEADLKSMQDELQKKGEAFDKEQASLPDNMQAITAKILDAIKAIGQTGGYVYIMENNSLPYISTTLSTDVTAQVKAKLGLK